MTQDSSRAIAAMTSCGTIRRLCRSIDVADATPNHSRFDPTDGLFLLNPCPKQGMLTMGQQRGVRRAATL
jgi:hypothetical protein